MFTALAAAALLHGSISLGLGVSYGLAGPRVELRLGHVAASAAFGLIPPSDAVGADGDLSQLHTGLALGVRGFLGDGEGLFVAATWIGETYQHSLDPYGEGGPYDAARLDVFSAVAGWRFRFGQGFYLEAAAGVGEARSGGHPQARLDPRNPFVRQVQVFPDVALGFGFEL